MVPQGPGTTVAVACASRGRMQEHPGIKSMLVHQQYLTRTHTRKHTNIHTHGWLHVQRMSVKHEEARQSAGAQLQDLQQQLAEHQARAKAEGGLQQQLQQQVGLFIGCLLSMLQLYHLSACLKFSLKDRVSCGSRWCVGGGDSYKEGCACMPQLPGAGPPAVKQAAIHLAVRWKAAEEDSSYKVTQRAEEASWSLI
eukprot:1162103-Pelagomonas_calceolata.AAC.8